MPTRLIGVIVAYNPDKKLILNIDSYLKDLDRLIVIDNSEGGQNFHALGIISEKIRLIRKPENIGIAAALNIAAGIALQHGYNWMLTMDQDSAFEPGSFSVYATLPDTIEYADKIAVLGPEVFEANENPPDRLSNIQLEEADLLITSGSLINLAVWKEIGGFEDKLFIDEVDHDYCLKALQRSFKVVLAKGIYLSHNLGKPLFLTKNFGTVRKTLHPPVRLYYIVRNGLYLTGKYAKDFSKICRQRKKIIFVTVKNNLCCGPSKITQLKYILKGLWHYRTGQYGKLKSTIK